jgi:hypothetical protein
VISAGIFVGLLADGWWQDRDDANREQVALRDLTADLRADSVELATFLRAARDWDAAAVWVAQHEGMAEDLDSASARLRPLFNFVSYRPQRAAYASLRDAGDLGLLSDPSLRLEVIRYFDTHQVYATQLHERVGPIVDNVREVGRRHTRALLADTDESMTDGVLWSLREGWARTSTDRDFVGAMTQLGTMGALVSERLETALQENAVVQAAIRAKLR